MYDWLKVFFYLTAGFLFYPPVKTRNRWLGQKKRFFQLSTNTLSLIRYCTWWALQMRIPKRMIWNKVSFILADEILASCPLFLFGCFQLSNSKFQSKMWSQYFIQGKFYLCQQSFFRSWKSLKTLKFKRIFVPKYYSYIFKLSIIFKR